MGGVGCHTGGMAGGRAGLGCARYDATRRSPDVLLPRVRQGRDSVRWEHTLMVWWQCVFPHRARRGAEHRPMLQGYRKGMYAYRLRATGRVRRMHRQRHC
jgi:hypothetical protein